MRNLKMLGLLAVILGALLVLTAGASATTITSPTGSSYTGEIKATTEKHSIITNPIANIECHSSVVGKVESHGAGQTAKANVSSLLWGSSGNLNGTCTNSWHVTTVSAGSLELHWRAEHEGTLTSSGAKIDATRFGVTCVYETAATDLGTVTDSHRTGTTAAPSTATVHLNAQLPLTTIESSGLCGSHFATWTASYMVETPDLIYIDKE